MKNILFIGNSYTYYNNLPLMVETLARGAGINVHCDRQVRPGADLHAYADPEAGEGVNGYPDYTDKIGCWLKDIYCHQFPGQAWDGFVIQDQSFNPVGNRADFIASAQKICSELFTNGEKVFLYQTWPYKAGSRNYEYVKSDYETMYQGLRSAYREAAEKTGAVLAAAGDNMKLAAQEYPEIELYQPDGSHPTPIATYMNACLFVAVMFGISPLELQTIEGLNAADAEKLRSIAYRVWTER